MHIHIYIYGIITGMLRQGHPSTFIKACGLGMSSIFHLFVDPKQGKTKEKNVLGLFKEI